MHFAKLVYPRGVYSLNHPSLVTPLSGPMVDRRARVTPSPLMLRRISTPDRPYARPSSHPSSRSSSPSRVALPMRHTQSTEQLSPEETKGLQINNCITSCMWYIDSFGFCVCTGFITVSHLILILVAFAITVTPSQVVLVS